jgi:hypothetical protein
VTTSERVPAEVTKDEFFDTIGPRDAHPRPVGNYPYTSHFTDQRTHEEIGRVVGGKTGESSRYYLLENPDGRPGEKQHSEPEVAA